MELKEPIKLARVLEQLESVFPGLRGHSKGGVEERYASLPLHSGGRILRLEDKITNQDTIEIIPRLWEDRDKEDHYERRLLGKILRVNLSNGRIWEETPQGPLQNTLAEAVLEQGFTI